MTKIKYLIGDATNPIGDDNKLIIHISNNIGAWGGGFTGALSRKWGEPEFAYRKWFSNYDNYNDKEHKSYNKFVLGNVQFVKVEDNITVVNMIAQEGIGRNKEGIPPIRYEALRECLIKANYAANQLSAIIHAPKLGSGLARGDWSIIEKMIEEIFTVDVYIYELN